MITQVEQAQSAGTRERVLEAAARLFHEQGYAATGIATILREANANPGSLYHYFPNKAALLAGVLERYRDLLETVLMRPVEARVEAPVERVFALLADYRRGMVETSCRLGCPVGNLALEVSDNHPEVRPLIDANFAGWKAGIARWLRDPKARLPGDCDIDSLAGFVLTTMEGGLMQARAAGRLDPFDESVSVLRNHFDYLQIRADMERRE